MEKDRRKGWGWCEDHSAKWNSNSFYLSTGHLIHRHETRVKGRGVGVRGGGGWGVGVKSLLEIGFEPTPLK